jgi:hypothetical protein
MNKELDNFLRNEPSKPTRVDKEKIAGGAEKTEKRRRPLEL